MDGRCHGDCCDFGEGHGCFALPATLLQNRISSIVYDVTVMCHGNVPLSLSHTAGHVEVGLHATFVVASSWL